MAILSGIAGIQMGDGNGGNIALSIQTRVMRILADSSHSYKTATIMNAESIKAGTATFYKPEVIQAEDYGTGTSAFNKPNASIVSVNIDIRRVVKWTYEEFDASRLSDTDYIISMISNGIALGIQADLNANYLSFVVNKLTTDTKLKKQNIVVDKLGASDGTTTPEQARENLNAIQFLIAKLSKKYDKYKLGVKKAEFMVFLDTIADINIRNAFYGNAGAIEYVIAKDLKGVQIGVFKYLIDDMFNNSIPAGTSFSKDKALDTTNFVGAVIHNEAIAMPVNFTSLKAVIDPDNGNPRFIAKYQFGIEMIRPDLVYGLVKTMPK